MHLKSPNLDDRTFHELLREARARVERTCPGWTDFSPGEPGTVLLELFAYLTELMLYRLNRLPDKAYVEFLNLLGVRLYTQTAAAVDLRFSLAQPRDAPTAIPRGTRVTAQRAGAAGEPPIFVTLTRHDIPAGESAAVVRACHAIPVEGELAGFGTGMPGLTVRAGTPPIVASQGRELGLVVGVECDPETLPGRAPALRHADKTYRIWREVTNFTQVEDPHVFVVDRLTGTITFAPAVHLSAGGGLAAAPAALAAVPERDREIRLWYYTGGGPAGNVAPGLLTVLKDPVPGVNVTNPDAAVGGRAAESLDNALVRGPHEFHASQRVVTARDFELLATSSSGAVARAKAFTEAAIWAHAPPGTVGLLLVPDVPEGSRERVDTALLEAHESEAAIAHLRGLLAERQPLGTNCQVRWARYKTTRIGCRVVVYREEDPEAVRGRVIACLHRMINPLPGKSFEGWRFGEPLRAWHVYEALRGEAGISYVDRVRLHVDSAPDSEVTSLSADAFQPRTWYAASGARVFRSLNDGAGWERIAEFPDERVHRVRAYPREAGGSKESAAGLLAVVTRPSGEENRAGVYISEDCGETWRSLPRTRFAVDDIAWITRDGINFLLLATDVGLYELRVEPESVPIQTVVDPARPKLGFFAVAATRDIGGTIHVAAAARDGGGVFLSNSGGRSETFRQTGLRNELVQRLTVQHVHPHAYLWAGIFAPGTEAGKGCFRLFLSASPDETPDWTAFGAGWRGGSCRALAFQGTSVLAGSRTAGVLRLDLRAQAPQWWAPDIDCGLPLRETGGLLAIDALACDPDGHLVMAGGERGVHQSGDGGQSYKPASARAFEDRVTIPETWLLCSGEHAIEVVSEDDAERD